MPRVVFAQNLSVICELFCLKQMSNNYNKCGDIDIIILNSTMMPQMTITNLERCESASNRCSLALTWSGHVS